MNASSLLNEACSRPQLGRTWCCPCLAQVAYGETQTFMHCEGVFCKKMDSLNLCGEKVSEVVEKGNVESSHETVSSGGVQGLKLVLVQIHNCSVAAGSCFWAVSNVALVFVWYFQKF